MSVDHFLPKSKYPHLAYEWKNYRLARPKLNHHKADSEDVLDPFDVYNWWFVLECPSCYIRASKELRGKSRQGVVATIDRLRLNEEELLAERCAWLIDLASSKISFDHMTREYPFLAYQVDRQGIKKRLRTLFALN